MPGLFQTRQEAKTADERVSRTQGRKFACVLPNSVARRASEDARYATIAAVGATADALRANLVQMQFLADAPNTLQGFIKKPGCDQ